MKGKKGKANSPRQTIIEQLDKVLERRLNLIFFLSLFFTVLFGAYLFDVKISTGGDDSHYIEMANDFIKGRAFPSWHGPLYSVFLSLPMLIFGVNVVVMKLFSFAFIIAHLVLFYFTFRRLISPTLFMMVMLIVSVNSAILYFASQTYTEAMYMFLQSLIVFLFVNTYLALNSSQPLSTKEQTIHWLVLGFFVFLASLTRDIGIVSLFAMLFMLLIEKRYRASAMLVVSYAIFFIPFRLYKWLVWGSDISKGSRPISEILLKNYYNASEGYEDFSGMVIRFFENARLYLSKHFMIGLGLHDPASTSKSWFVTFVVILLFLIALYYAFKRNRIMLFVVVYLGASVAATFIALQQSWDQMRMVIIYIPMLLLLLAWGIQQMASRKGYGILNLVLLAMLVLIFFKTFKQTVDKMKANQKVLAKNLKGNLYYGFTPDWQNYLLMSEWVGTHIPDSVVVASRKPSISFIYSKGRDFYGIYKFPTEEPAKLIGELAGHIGDLLVIPNKDVDNTLPVPLRLIFKSGVVAYVAEGSDIFGVYEMNEGIRDALLPAISQFKLPAISTDSLLNRVKVSDKTCFAVSPDSLLNTLKKNKVGFVLVASLRANPNANTGNIINTIQRYLYFIEQKYPGILTLVHQIGTEVEEPAWLYRIDYKTYRL